MESLRSALTMDRAEDTSLALPSESAPRDRQQRVLDQVHSVRRARSTKDRSTSHSGAGPRSQSVSSDFRSLKFPSAGIGETLQQNSYFRSVRQRHSRTVSTKGTVRRQMSGGTFENNLPPSKVQTLKSSRSDPALAPSSSQAQRTSVIYHSYGSTKPTANQATVSRSRLSQSNLEAKIGAGESGRTNWTGSSADITMVEAVEFLSSKEERMQLRGASFIQHSTYDKEEAKQEVYQLNGIVALVGLLQSASPQLQHTAAAALRNAVFKSEDNKQEVQQCGGIPQAVALLSNTVSADTQKQVTGLLWNLSSAENLKADLIQSALPVLTQNVVIPFTCWSDSSNNNNVDPEVFSNTCGCLRNLSGCAAGEQRQSMRFCPGLIDALVSYVQSCVTTDKVNDKSLENCVCILHNLTYNLETEAPQLFGALTDPDAHSPNTRKSSTSRKSPVLACFSPKSSKVHQKKYFDFTLPEDRETKGAHLLLHSKTIESYLCLLGSSNVDGTLEACCGALQNLTAIKGPVSSHMSSTVVQKLKGLQYISPLLHRPSLQRSVVSLVANMSRYPSLNRDLAQQVLPPLTYILTSGREDMDSYDKTMAAACQSFHSLITADMELTKKLLNDSLVQSLCDLSSKKHYIKASKAAAVLLYGLWMEKEIQGHLKKQGMNKSIFVNEMTKEAWTHAETLQVKS